MATAQARAAHLGEQIMAAVFEAHVPARGEVFGLIQARLLAGKPEACLPYLSLLAGLVRQQPTQMSMQATRIKASFLPFFAAVYYPQHGTCAVRSPFAPDSSRLGLVGVAGAAADAGAKRGAHLAAGGVADVPRAP